ncbi:MAG TPA: sensor histidine kinase [Verrucomicrobiae bacterium]|nr:sensor histidine kinase [Verrucomicrobiae bacterium]
MKNDEVSPTDKGASSRATQDAAVADWRAAQHEVHKLRTRVANLEAALDRSNATAEMAVHKTAAFEQRRNVKDAVREAAITSLESDNQLLLIRIDTDALNLATAEERLRGLSTELILAHEQEQRRIARELHDELGQQLTALKMLLNRGKSAEGGSAKELFVEASELSETLLQTVRDICSRLRPQVLDDLGLMAGLSVHLKNFGSRSGLTIQFEHGAIDEQRLSPIAQSVVYRVIQEAVTNVARHAKVEHALVRITMDAEVLVFVVQDKGCGFDPERVKETTSTGLSSMVERVLLLDGSCEIVSAPNVGTTVTARIPLKAEAGGS